MAFRHEYLENETSFPDHSDSWADWEEAINLDGPEPSGPC